MTSHALGPGKSAIALALAAGFLLSPTWSRSQTLGALIVEPRQAAAGEPVKIRVELQPAKGDPWCGLVIDFGNNVNQDVRVGSNGTQDLNLAFTQKYAEPGLYVVTVQGKFLQRGLRSVPACGGRLSPLTVQVQ